MTDSPIPFDCRMDIKELASECQAIAADIRAAKLEPFYLWFKDCPPPFSVLDKGNGANIYDANGNPLAEKCEEGTKITFPLAVAALDAYAIVMHLKRCTDKLAKLDVKVMDKKTTYLYDKVKDKSILVYLGNEMDRIDLYKLRDGAFWSHSFTPGHSFCDMPGNELHDMHMHALTGDIAQIMFNLCNRKDYFMKYVVGSIISKGKSNQCRAMLDDEQADLLKVQLKELKDLLLLCQDYLIALVQQHHRLKPQMK